MAKKNFVLKDEYQKGKIAVRNNTLGRMLKLTGEQVISMAKRGKLSASQLQTMFKSYPIAKEEKPEG